MGGTSRGGGGGWPSPHGAGGPPAGGSQGHWKRGRRRQPARGRERARRRAARPGTSPRRRLPPGVGRRSYRPFAGTKRSESLVALCRGAPDARGRLHCLSGCGGWRQECDGVSPFSLFCSGGRSLVVGPGRPVSRPRASDSVQCIASVAAGGACLPVEPRQSLPRPTLLFMSVCAVGRQESSRPPPSYPPPRCPPRIVHGPNAWWQRNERERHALNGACSAWGVVSPHPPSRGATRGSYTRLIR